MLEPSLASTRARPRHLPTPRSTSPRLVWSPRRSPPLPIDVVLASRPSSTAPPDAPRPASRPVRMRLPGRAWPRRGFARGAARVPGAIRGSWRSCYAEGRGSAAPGSTNLQGAPCRLAPPFLQHREVLLHVPRRRSALLRGRETHLQRASASVGMCGHPKKRPCIAHATPPPSRDSPTLPPPPAGAARLSATHLVDAFPSELVALKSLCAPHPALLRTRARDLGG